MTRDFTIDFFHDPQKLPQLVYVWKLLLFRSKVAFMMDIDDPSRIDELRAQIRKKGFLKRFYEEVYREYAAVLAKCPKEGFAIELGSGAGFVKEVLSDVVTSDTLPYKGVDRVIDATKMPFEDSSLRAIFMLNVFHHIPDAAAFLSEASRCLKPGGRIFMRDQHVGWLSRIILKHVHHEPFDPDAKQWSFASSGPLSGANGALAWIVFKRDRARFEAQFPCLRLERYRPHTPFRYWASGGLKNWTLLPGKAFRAVSAIESALVGMHEGWSSFTDIELVKHENTQFRASFREMR